MTQVRIRPPFHILRRAITAAMLMPFLALCLLSPASMLERGANGSLVMVLCTGDGPVKMTVDLGTGHDKGTLQSKQRCDWAAAHSAVLNAATFAMLSTITAYHRAAPALATALWHPAYDPRNLWARGPPHLV